MKQRSWLALMGGVLLLTSCSGSPQQQAQVAPKTSETSKLPAPSKTQNFPKPLVSPTAVVTVSAVPGLVQSTNGTTRLSTVVTGRPDPFAGLPKAPLTLVASTSTSTAPRSVPQISRPMPAAPQPARPNNSTSLPPVAPNSLPIGALPPLPAPPSPTAMAEAIEVTGAVQVGGKWQIIVKEPGTETSRYVSIGDSLSNGRVQIKRVIGGSSGDPIVVLQQNGREVTKAIGIAANRFASR
ncbi:MAG TPA: hypothetical protein V6D18_15720 [Thermosynechococcaceae cyanobacterium]